MVMIWGCWQSVMRVEGRCPPGFWSGTSCLRRRPGEQYLALSQAIRQHGVQQSCDVIGHIAATISFGAYCNDVPTIGQPSLVI